MYDLRSRAEKDKQRAKELREFEAEFGPVLEYDPPNEEPPSRKIKKSEKLKQ